MKQIICLSFLLRIAVLAFSQPTAGTTGLLNSPTAEMQRDGTFMFGGNYLPSAIMPTKLGYNSGNYYLNITFLPFLEVNYRCTFLQIKNTGKYNQDRSFAIRGRMFRERKYIPALVIGANDIYTSSSGKGNQYFGAMYIVTSKKLAWNKNRLETSAGYGFEAFRNNQIIGLFGGISYSPGFCRSIKLMAEYDSKVINAGGALYIFDRLQIVVFAYDLTHFVGGLAYKIYL